MSISRRQEEGRKKREDKTHTHKQHTAHSTYILVKSNDISLRSSLQR